MTMSLKPTPTQIPNPNPHHRKIELQSLQDLSYLQTNLHTALNSKKLDLHFPPLGPPKNAAEPRNLQHLLSAATRQPNPAQHRHQHNKWHFNRRNRDPMRQRVETLVNAFTPRTWDSASHSISINGLDATSLPLYLSIQTPNTATKPDTG
ncbi:hypothetical protein ABVK25_011984 [Lepraria finkii]|uniref:Uncharacterized protein n=1 Tax=Lepraria finkii TaxID=1340010 RepID=A0ABR4AK47_9LECA